MDANPRRRRWPWFRLLLCACLAVSLLYPPTREIQVLTFRFIFGINGKTVVKDRPLYCALVRIPSIGFSEQAEAELLVQAPTSPDAFLICTIVLRKSVPPPPPEAWQDHPLIAVAATQGVARLRLAPQPGQRFRDYPPAVAMTPALRKHAMRLRDLVASAQRRFPKNGGLWLSQAGLDFYAGDQAEALENLRIASQKSCWDTQAEFAFRYVRGLLEQQGWPAVDVCSSVYPEFFNYNIVRPLREDIATLLAETIVQCHEEQFANAASVVFALQNRSWQRNTETWGFLNAACDADVLNAMARHFGSPPDPEKDGVHRTAKQADDLARRYLSEHGFAGQIERTERLRREAEDRRSLSSPYGREKWRMLDRRYTVSWIADLVFVTTAVLLLCAVVLRIPVALVSLSATATRRRFLVFWLVVLACLLAAVWTCLRVRRDHYAFSEYGDLLAALVFFHGLAIVVAVVRHPPGKRLRLLSTVISAGCVVYLLAAAASAYCRARLVEKISEDVTAVAIGLVSSKE